MNLDFSPEQQIERQGRFEKQSSYGTQEPIFDQLTPEEQRILKECAKEGIVQRAIPSAIMCGLGGYLGAKGGPLMHSKYGVKPAVIAFSILGYYIGRVSYSKVCFNRVMEVPDGNLQKIFGAAKRQTGQSPDAFYATIDTPKTQEPRRAPQSSSTDIDLQSTSSFDTVPSDYYKADKENLTEEARAVNIPQNYTSYDELRNQNRQQYTNRLYPEGNRNTTQARYSELSQERPTVRRPGRHEEVENAETAGRPRSQTNKYGDAWE